MNEIRDAFRQLCRTPGFTLVALVVAVSVLATVLAHWIWFTQSRHDREGSS
jgi:type II secretory pathway component PulJ